MYGTVNRVRIHTKPLCGIIKRSCKFAKPLSGFSWWLPTHLRPLSGFSWWLPTHLNHFLTSVGGVSQTFGVTKGLERDYIALLVPFVSHYGTACITLVVPIETEIKPKA